MDEPIVQESTTHPFKFTGNGREYFKIWIVNILLSIVTLGIYSAWAKVRTNRYFYGNTFFNDANFEYHATGWQIFKGRIIAALALVIYVAVSELFPQVGFGLMFIILLATPWIIWNSYRFNARITSYRQVRFSFDGSLSTAYKYMLLLPFLPAVAIGLIAGATWLLLGMNSIMAIFILAALAMISIYAMGPYVQALMYRYRWNNAHYGQGDFSANISISVFFKTYLFILGIFLLFSAIIAAIGYAAGIETMISAKKESSSEPGLFNIFFLVGYLFTLMFSFWAKAYMETRINNHVFNELKLDNVLNLHSSLQVKPLFWIHITNLFLIIFTLGLAIPFAKVRLANYRADSTSGTITQDLAHYASLQQQKQSALGDELGEAFDLQGDLGISL